MTAQPFRRGTGGLIDRARTLAFTFDGRRYLGHPGDTLASALLANGIRVVGRSFKYHRPRGIFSAGPEEPNALVRLGAGARAEPNTRATMAELFDGLVAESQNRWPSLSFDLMRVNDHLAPLFPAGFYYKTFMWPPRLWGVYEWLIRRAAGLGRAPDLADPDRYEHCHVHCDVLVVGAGAAGLAAACAAARSAARVILVDERAAPGGALRFEHIRIGGQAASEWAASAADEFAGSPRARFLPRTTAFACFDHGVVGLVERVGDHAPASAPGVPRQRLWLVRARRVILATGAIERPLVFADNDLPGVMLASAARRYANEFAALPGRTAVVATDNDDAYRTALDLQRAGVAVAAVVDVRGHPHSAASDLAASAGIECIAGHGVARARGRGTVTAVEIAPVERGAPRRLPCDLVCVSGGWSPTVHLHCQAGGKLDVDEALAALVPVRAAPGFVSVGAARGTFAFAAAIAEGEAAGAAAAAELGFSATPACAPAVEDSVGYVGAPWPAAPRRGKRFVDFQADVTEADIALAHRENYRSVEHLKRYTTLGMGTDQGKTSSVNGLALLAALRGEPIAAVGTTTFRPPYTPVAFGAIAGAHIGAHYDAVRRTPLHGWHVAHGAAMMEAGQWLRPRVYLRPGENMHDAWMREARTVRGAVGLVDVSTLGKIDVQGPDAGAFLERVYCNPMRLDVGKVRYGLMLREDGIVLDDGTCARLGEQRYVLTTTTAHAAQVLLHLEFLLEVAWPALRVRLSAVTEQWAQMALAGPESRAVLARAADLLDVSREALPPLAARNGVIAGVPIRVFRVSYSGELAYEIAAPADCGAAVWEALLAAGAAFGIAPYGLEAMGVLRIEKGHVAGAEIDGRTTPADLGLARLVSRKKNFVGCHLLRRLALADPARPALVGLVPADGTTPIRAGAQLTEDPSAPASVALLGHVTSATHSPALGHPIALGLLREGAARKGGEIVAASPLFGEAVRCRVVDPVFYDCEGVRQNG
jgi:sarcosine oxidase subunit alpha